MVGRGASRAWGIWKTAMQEGQKESDIRDRQRSRLLRLEPGHCSQRASLPFTLATSLALSWAEADASQYFCIRGISRVMRFQKPHKWPWGTPTQVTAPLTHSGPD